MPVDTDIIYAEDICDACLLLLSEAPVVITLHYPGETPLHFHQHCYEAISGFLLPPEALLSNLEEKVRLWQLQSALRQSWPGGALPDRAQ